jgi:PAS domain S-box-containing protein
MRAPPTPANEPERLADLYDYGLLDTPAERVFDEIAELAATICGTRFAAVTLVDRDRQWFKAVHGGLRLTQTPRDQSVCAHAILENGLFEVPDLDADARFAGNPVLAGDPRLRFYGGTPLASQRGNAIGMLCVLDPQPRRLTATQRQSLQQLADVLMAVVEAGRQSRLRGWLGALMDRVSENILIIEPHTLRYLHANASALESLGYSLAQLQSMTAVEISTQRKRQEFEAYVLALRTGTPQIVFEDVRHRANGEVYPAEVRWQLLSTNGQPVVISLVQDITQRKQMERMKDEFISVVNHELRTPLTSIHGAVKLLEQGAGGEMPPKAARLVHLAAENTERLRRIVDDILDLEQIASGRMQFRFETTEARAALEQAARAYETAARSAGVAFAVDAPDGLALRADAQRLHQVLANLVSNAIKFAPRDSRVTLSAAATAPDTVRIEVVDHGPGIPEEFRKRIFQRFAQADMNTRRTKGGSGLGLSIAKQMTEHMAGTIGFESEPGRTCFFLQLPEVKR